ncbi:MAG: glycosyltransferase [Ferruginibacter sp.]
MSPANPTQRIYLCATSDPRYDQRMRRIASSLQQHGWDVTLIGRSIEPKSTANRTTYKTKLLAVPFKRGKAFYASYNIRLFFHLLVHKPDVIYAVDLDTILPCLMASMLLRKPRIYDAHELFCEMQEIVRRPFIYRIWKKIESFAVSKFKHTITVNQAIADELSRLYKINPLVIRNMPVTNPYAGVVKKTNEILYQGAVNEGRAFDALLEAMRSVDGHLTICGDGNYMAQVRALIQTHRLEQKVSLLGMVLPEALQKITAEAAIGITLFEKTAESNRLSLANRFFDYVQGHTPQLCVGYPEYLALNKIHPVSVLIEEPLSDQIAAALNKLLHDNHEWEQRHLASVRAAQDWNWQQEEKKLLDYVHAHFR